MCQSSESCTVLLEKSVKWAERIFILRLETHGFLHHVDSNVRNRNTCINSEIYVVLVSPVISDFLGHPEDEDQQALYPVITVSHP